MLSISFGCRPPHEIRQLQLHHCWHLVTSTLYTCIYCDFRRPGGSMIIHHMFCDKLNTSFFVLMYVALLVFPWVFQAMSMWHTTDIEVAFHGEDLHPRELRASCVNCMWAPFQHVIPQQLTFRKYPAIHTNYIISHSTTLQYNHTIWHGRPYIGSKEILNKKNNDFNRAAIFEI